MQAARRLHRFSCAGGDGGADGSGDDAAVGEDAQMAMIVIVMIVPAMATVMVGELMMALVAVMIATVAMARL